MTTEKTIKWFIEKHFNVQLRDSEQVNMAIDLINNLLVEYYMETMIEKYPNMLYNIYKSFELEKEIK